MNSHKILSLEELLKKVNHWKKVGDKIVFTNGCFDVLHPGHISLLKSCRELGEQVIIGLNTDVSVKKLKGENRPFHNESERAFLLAAIEFVDVVVLFSEENPLKLIQLIKPDFLVKGGDYKKEDIIGSSFVEANQGKVVIVPFVENHSTTKILSRIK